MAGSGRRSSARWHLPVGGERTERPSHIFPNRPGLITYVGPSMYPTLRTLDIIRYRPYDAGCRMRRGDVILFRPPGRNRIVIHRVVAVTHEGIRTQGDNNLSCDPYLLTCDAVLGRVLSAHREGREIAVRGGAAGWCRGSALRLRRRAVHTLAVALRHPCDALAGRCPIQIPFLRVAAFKRTRGTELHLLLAGRSIGRLPTGERRWLIRRPFGLIVNEEALPRPKPEGNHE
ncbi:signal peptidase I [Methanofollis aquaemaris]|nr:signal peptidase I [Methanofollis aquaemaris]